MNESNVVELKAPAEDALGELLKEGARQLLAQAIEAEVAELLIQYADQTVNGKRAVVRNGCLPERSIQTGLGEVPVKVPKVRDRSGGGIKFNSKLVPPYLKRTKNVEEFIPCLVPERDLDRGDAAIEAEVAELLIQYADQTVNGKRAVVRNGYLPERSIQTGLGEVPVKVPKVRDRSGGGIKFNSKLVPPYLKRTKNVEEFIPWLYLKGISTGEMQPALEALLGEGATGLSAATVSRLKKSW